MVCKVRHLEVSLLGGFGNQLFQLANAISISLQYSRPFTFKSPDVGRPTAIDQIGIFPGLTYYAEIHDGNLRVREVDSRCTAFFMSKYIERNFTYNKIELNESCVRIKGYFQSYKYFEHIEAAFRNWLIDRLDLKVKVRANSFVGLHLRFGDMANNPTFRNYHGVISEDYIFSALASYNVKVGSLRVVTENRTDVQRELPNFFRMDPTFLVGQNMLEDFRLLTEFQKIIISNSTFSWWAAWCSQACTIAPKKWFTDDVQKLNPIGDLVLKNWTLL